MIKDDFQNQTIYLWKGHKVSKGAYKELTFDIQWKEDIERRIAELEKLIDSHGVRGWKVVHEEGKTVDIPIYQRICYKCDARWTDTNGFSDCPKCKPSPEVKEDKLCEHSADKVNSCAFCKKPDTDEKQETPVGYCPNGYIDICPQYQTCDGCDGYNITSKDTITISRNDLTDFLNCTAINEYNGKYFKKFRELLTKD